MGRNWFGRWIGAHIGFGDGKSNTANYLAGGTALAPGVTSANLTPNLDNGRPEDEDTTFQIFRQRIRTGHDVSLYATHNQNQVKPK